MSLESNAFHLLLLATALALTFFLVRLVAGWMVGQGQLGDSIGNALLAVFP